MMAKFRVIENAYNKISCNGCDYNKMIKLPYSSTEIVYEIICHKKIDELNCKNFSNETKTLKLKSDAPANSIIKTYIN